MDDYRIRVRIFIGLILVVLGILGLRLAQLQLVNAREYTGESRSNAVREKRVQPARGAIYDRGGTLMVDNAQSFTVLITPRYFDEPRTALLADLLEVPDSVVVARLQEARSWSPFRPSRSFREVPFSVFSRVLEHQYLLPGVTFDVEQKRRYHTEAQAAHALGYIREITRNELEERRTAGYYQGDLIGKAGLERHYEAYLRGELGREFKLVNVRGIEFKAYQDGDEDTDPVGGYDLHLTIDSDVQALAESLFVNKRGAAVALDPQSGDILALVSAPGYEPELFAESIDLSTWRYLTKSADKPMFNRATMMGLPPGSTWKPLMALIGLEEGIITERTRLACNEGYRLGRRLFRNHGWKRYGYIDVKKAMEVSCNSFFFEIMMKTDVNTWQRWAKQFGFGQRIDMDVSEQTPGLVPDSAYFNRAYPNGWHEGYTINLGIGQGDMVVTPMELARFTAALANGGTLHGPRLVQKLVHPETGRALHPSTAEPRRIPVQEKHMRVVRESLRQVMESEEGTGRGVRIPGIPSAGKTGTVENSRGEDHSLFIMFAPYEDPQIAVAVMVENAGYGGTVAAPIASLMAEQYLKGEIEMTWWRRFHIDRLMNELKSETEEDRRREEAATFASSESED